MKILEELREEDIEILNSQQIQDKEWLQSLKWLKRKLENYICNRTYKDTPYEKGIPTSVLENLRKEVIKPFFKTLDFNAIYQYFKKKKLEASKLISYIEYRYLRFYYFDYLKKLYEDSKKFPYFYLKCNPLYHETPKNLYITYQEYPKNFIHVENTLNNVPNFEHDKLFAKEKKARENIEDLKSVGISLEQKKEKLLWQNGYIVVENIPLLENFLGISITHKNEYALYNLYDYIYDKEILDFLEKYHTYLHDPTLSSIEEFYKKTKMKVRVVVSDKYRGFTFDRYGIIGTDCFGRQTYIYGDYLKDMMHDWEEYERKDEDYDLRVIFEVEHIDYDEEGIYYQDVYDKWDPLYEDAMEEEEKEKFTNEESEKNYLFRK